MHVLIRVSVVTRAPSLEAQNLEVTFVISLVLVQFAAVSVPSALASSWVLPAWGQTLRTRPVVHHTIPPTTVPVTSHSTLATDGVRG